MREEGLAMVEPLCGERLEALLDRLPATAGVYLMKDLLGRVVYVGKAKNLRNRVRSYFRASGDSRAFVGLLPGLLGDLEVVVTPSEKDALILERELIGQHHPRFNIDLRDDKNYLSIRISADKPYPRLVLERRHPSPARGRAREQGGRWFGPYPSAQAVRETYKLIQRVFQLRSCPDRVFRDRLRPCMLYQIGRCLGPCVPDLPPDVYAQRVDQAVQFLRGHYSALLVEMAGKMGSAAEGLRFEEAALWRDRIRAIQRTLSGKELLGDSDRDQDVLGLYREGASGVLVLLKLRQGRLLTVVRFPFQGVEAPDSDVIRQFLIQHFFPGADCPDEILLPASAVDAEEEEAGGAEGAGPTEVNGGSGGDPASAGAQGSAEPSPADLSSEDPFEEKTMDRQAWRLIEQWFSDHCQASVKVAVPRRGRRMRLLDWAHDNAREAFRVSTTAVSLASDRLERLRARLHLSRTPQRIECFDLSTLGGRLSVGSMAVMMDGEVTPALYRRYRIRQAQADSDVAMMREVVGRRLRPVLEGSEPPPDLIVLDGGIGQLQAVVALFGELGVSNVDLVALAKGRALRKKNYKNSERVFIPGRKNPVPLRPGSDELFLLSRVRDEAHRFAIGFHRRLRRRSSLKSLLDEIPGVGAVLKKRLLASFGNVKTLREAGAAEISRIPGISPTLAARIRALLDAVATSDRPPASGGEEN